MRSMSFFSIVLMLSCGAFADNAWTGAGGNNLWTTPGNWNGGHAPVNTDLNLFFGAGMDTGDDLIVIDSTMNISLNCDLYGPEWGLDLDIDGGSLTQVFDTPVAGEGNVFAPLADSGAQGIINVRNGGTLHVKELCIGDNWWFAGHPYITLNVYDTSSVIADGWCWLGGRINLYSGTVDIAGSMNFATANGFARINIEAGTLTIRDAAFLASTAQGWEDGGFLVGYGGEGDVIIDDSTGDVVITAIPSLAAKDPDVQPLNPNGTVGNLVSDTQVQVTLNWNAGIDPNLVRGLPFNPDILTHYVWVGAEGQPMTLRASVPQLSETDPANSYDIVLNQGTLYYWSIEEGVDNGSGFAYPSGDPNNIPGDVWSFRTKAMTPEILTDPVNAVASPNAVFTVTGSDVVTGYQWYKEAGASDIALTDNATYAGTQTATLTVTNAALADEGQYYCVAKNGTLNSEPSAPAMLWTQRLMGHWKFDGNMLDSVAAIVPGAAAHDGILGVNSVAGDGLLTYGTGINGNSAVFANDGDYVAIADPNFFNFYPLGFTVSFWYKETGAAGWRLPMSKLDGGVGGWLFGTDDAFRNQATFFTNPQDGAEFWADGNADIDLADGQWHMITGIYDPATTTYTIFTDGDQNESIVLDWSAMPLAAAPLSIGGRNTESSIQGEIDDVQIFSYVLTPLQIAQKYLAFEPGQWVCVEDLANPLTMDVTGDCRITIADFAVLAGEWLECQRIPAGACAW